MKWVWMVVMVALAACGCTRQEKAQQQLITQLQSGLAGVGEFCDARQEQIEQSYAQKRRTLDDAFDLDVTQAPAMDGAWVIEHRKAYAAALEGVWSAQQASRESHRRAMASIAAISEGLERLRWMSEMRGEWAKAFEQIRQGVSDEPR